MKIKCLSILVEKDEHRENLESIVGRVEALRQTRSRKVRVRIVERNPLPK